MKLYKQVKFWAFSTMVIAVGYLASCTKGNQVLDLPTPTPTPTTNSSKDLVSVKVTTAPTIDGTIDAIWDQATKLNIKPTVPDPGNNLFTGYSGDAYPVTLRSVYDDTYVYFLAEYADNTKSTNVQPWYFNSKTKLWAQEPNSRQFDANGALTRVGFAEDKIAMLFNIDNSTSKFASQTCYSSCHVFTPYMDYSTTTPTYKSNASSGNHYTNGVNEKIDMWWGHLSRDVAFKQMDDNYQDWAGGPAISNLTGGSSNGRHVDDIVVNGASTTWPYRPTYTTVAAQGATNNRQTLKLDGTGASVTVPWFIIPGVSNYDFIKASDTAVGGLAQKVTAVSSTGVLTYGNGLLLDPNFGTDFQRGTDTIYGGIGAKCIPSFIAAPLIGGRADIICDAVYTGTGWVVEYKRKLKTGDTLKQDVDFTNLPDSPFGFAVWDASNYQHAIQPGLVLKFKK